MSRKAKQGQWYQGNRDTTCDLSLLRVIVRPCAKGYQVGVTGRYGRWLKNPIADYGEAKVAGLELVKKIGKEIIKQADRVSE